MGEVFLYGRRHFIDFPPRIARRTNHFRLTAGVNARRLHFDFGWNSVRKAWTMTVRQGDEKVIRQFYPLINEPYLLRGGDPDEPTAHDLYVFVAGPDGRSGELLEQNDPGSGDVFLFVLSGEVVVV